MLSIRPALIGIGSIAICFGLNDILGFYAPRSRTGWLLAHLSAMLAAYISATTAFLVINAHHVPMVLRWALPSASAPRRSLHIRSAFSGRPWPPPGSACGRRPRR